MRQPALKKSGNRFERYPKTVLVCVFVVFFFFLELGVRIFNRITSPPEATLSYKEKHFRNRWISIDNVPNNTFIHPPSHFDSFKPVVNNINSMGIRGPEIAKKNRYRILNVGDSFVEADNVEWEKTFSELLNRHFSKKMEFIAHGIGGWAPTIEFSWIYHKGMKLYPDEVNLFLCLNDFYRSEVSIKVDQTSRIEANYKDGIPVEYEIGRYDGPPNIKRTLVVEILNHVTFLRPVYNLYHTLKLKLLATLYGSSPSQGEEIVLLAQDPSKWSASLAKNVDETIDVVLELNRYLKKHHVKLNVTMVPFPFAWENECRYGKLPLGFDKSFAVSQDGIENYLQAKLKESGIPYIDLRRSFDRAKRENPDTLLYYPEDCHWNKDGHKIVFETLKLFHGRH